MITFHKFLVIIFFDNDFAFENADCSIVKYLIQIFNSYFLMRKKYLLLIVLLFNSSDFYNGNFSNQNNEKFTLSGCFNGDVHRYERAHMTL